jgi:enoyl-CoA hydratase
MRTMIDFELPVVAAVNGPAVGLGATLVLLCDLVVISETAFLCDPHVNVGLVAGDGGTVLWPQCMSLIHAKEYLLLGERVQAADCVRLGLANRVTSPEAVLPTALDLAARLAAQPRQALRDTKRAMHAYLRHGANIGLDFALAAESESLAGDDVLRTIARYTK